MPLFFCFSCALLFEHDRPGAEKKNGAPSKSLFRMWHRKEPCKKHEQRMRRVDYHVAHHSYFASCLKISGSHPKLLYAWLRMSRGRRMRLRESFFYRRIKRPSSKVLPLGGRDKRVPPVGRWRERDAEPADVKEHSSLRMSFTSGVAPLAQRNAWIIPYYSPATQGDKINASGSLCLLLRK